MNRLLFSRSKLCCNLSWPSVLQHVPWVTRMIHAAPFAGASIKKFALFAMKQAKIRCDKDVQKHDLFYFMVRENPLPIFI